MKNIVSHLLAASALLVAFSGCAPKNPVLTISGGKVPGVASDSANVLVFKGIPFPFLP
ncbi:MAG: hypothetical protein WCR48_08300 [Bacteroidales bacterium]